MKFNPEIHHRHSIRLKEYDYSNSGLYFITICTWQKERILCDIEESDLYLSKIGKIVKETWQSLPNKYSNVFIDEFVIMPNHFHGILYLNDIHQNECGGTVSVPSEQHHNCRGAVAAPNNQGGEIKQNRENNQGGETPPLLGQIIAFFKYSTTKRINEIRITPGYKVWQRNYYEHIIRNEKDLNAIREYIRNNPANWKKDPEYL